MSVIKVLIKFQSGAPVECGMRRIHYSHCGNISPLLRSLIISYWVFPSLNPATQSTEAVFCVLTSGFEQSWKMIQKEIKADVRWLISEEAMNVRRVHVKIFISRLAKGRVGLTVGETCFYTFFRILAGRGVLAHWLMLSVHISFGIWIVLLTAWLLLSFDLPTFYALEKIYGNRTLRQPTLPHPGLVEM